MKKFMFPITILIFLLFSPIVLAAEGPDLSCKSALLLDGQTGQILYEQNSTEQCYPASVTKIMTLVLILEAVEDGRISLEDQVTVSEEAASMGGSQVYLYPGESRSVEELLIGIAVGSGNDAAYAMAEYVGGSYDGFITMMNEKAAALGMEHTHFVNPHGLHDPEHYTTAADLGKLAVHALTLPHFLDYTSIYEYEFRSDPLLTLWNTNRLLKWFDGTDGMKTGYTEEAGRNLVATVERDGLRLISVVLGCDVPKGHFKESMTLLNYGFSRFAYTACHQAGEALAVIPVSKGDLDEVTLVTQTAVGYTHEKGQEQEMTEEITLAESIQAPAEAGTIGGELTVYLDGNIYMTVPLVTDTAVERGSIWRTWQKMLDLTFG